LDSGEKVVELIVRNYLVNCCPSLTAATSTTGSAGAAYNSRRQ